MITATVNPADVQRVGRLLSKVAFESGKGMFDLVRQTMIFALQSSAKDTKPGKSGTADGLAKKFKFRPILKSQDATKKRAGQYFYEFQDGKTFNTAVEIPAWQYSWQKIKRKIDKVVKWWNKEINTWDYTAYTGTPEQQKFLKTPHYGAGKVGWYGALQKLGKSTGGYGDNKAGNLSRTQVQRGQLEAGIAVTNMVDYVSKTSPQSAGVGLVNAEKRMVKTYENKLKMTLAGMY